MEGYYDHHPLLTLDRHLVVVGYFAAETRRVAYQLAALTGIGVNDLDRTVEHRAGQSVAGLIAEHGETAYRQLERNTLRHLLSGTPRSILSLGDGALIDDESREWVLEEARLVVLDLDLPGCFWKLRSKPEAEQAAWHPLYPGPVENFEQLRPFYELRAPGFSLGHHHIDVRGIHRGETVDRLMKLLVQ